METQDNSAPLSCAISAVLSLIQPPRVSVTVQIMPDSPGLKTSLRDYFLGAKLFAKIQRNGEDVTQVTIQGSPDQFPSALELLEGYLLANFPGAAIAWTDVSPVSSPDHRYTNVTIEETPSMLIKGPSSGEVFCGKHLEEISLGGSATTEQLKKIGREITESITKNMLAAARSIGYIKPSPEKHICVTYKDKTVSVETSSFSSMKDLITSLENEHFQQPQPFQEVLIRLDGDRIISCSGLSGLQNGYTYHALTVLEEPETLKNRHIRVIYKDKTVSMETYSFSSMKGFIKSLEDHFQQAQPFQEVLFQLHGKQAIPISDLEELKDGSAYHALTVFEEPRNLQKLRIRVTREDISVSVETSPFSSMKDLIKYVEGVFQHCEPLQQVLYDIDGNHATPILDLRKLQDGFTYHTLTVRDGPPNLQKLCIRVTHKDTTVSVEIPPFSSMKDVIKSLEGEFQQAQPFQHVFYQIEGNQVIHIRNLSGLQDRFTYHALTVLEKPQSLKKCRIRVTHKDTTVSVEISPFSSMKDLIKAIEGTFQQAQSFQEGLFQLDGGLFQLDGGLVIRITDLSELQEGCTYHTFLL